MATITLRSVKGSPLTNTEVDTNFTNLNNDKLESGSVTSSDFSGTTTLLIKNSAGTTLKTIRSPSS
jgi:hypothetical protein